MEGLYNSLHRTGQTLETEASIRPSKPPGGNSNPNPNAFESLGSTLRVASGSSQAQPKSKFKPHTTVSQKPTRQISIKKPLSEFFESEDELDLLSSQADPDDYQPSNKASVSKPGKYANGKGKGRDCDAKFPDKSQVLAKLKFNKIKKDNATTPSRSFKNQPVLKENSQGFGSWANDLKKKGADTGEFSGDDDILEISSPLRLKSSNQRPQSPPKQPVHHKLPDASLPGRPRPRPLPLPRPAYKSNADAGSKPAIFVDGHELFPLGRAKTSTVTKERNPSRSPSLSISTPKKKDGPSSQPSSPKNFPMDMISPLGGKVQQKPLPEPRNKVDTLPFEVSRKPSTFPKPSPQSSKRGTLQPKGKNKTKPFPLDVSDEDEADEESDRDEGKGRTKAKGRPPKNFPMEMISPLGRKVQKKFSPIPRNKVKPPSFKVSRKLKAFPMPSPPKHQKRMSEGRSDDERQAKKKRRSSLSPSHYNSEDEGDSITISPDTDPRTLCPYCDTPLPSSPSPLLIKILAATRKKSTRDPRPSNPLGLKAPLAIFIVACQRHKFESQILPEAERKGWPKTIQWKKLGARVERMKDELQALIEDPGGEHKDMDEDIDEVEKLFRDDGDGTSPKARSIFWTEVMDEVKTKGSRAVVGVRGQFANFEKTQPGYYGEQGSVIIHQTLFDMFPPASFDPTRILPLSSNEFVLRILVPEVALRLIMEDRDLEGNDGIQQALIVLRESSTYGVAMFPEDGGEGSTGKKRRDDVMFVGDKIVMERARKRRKELEEEEEEEEREEARRKIAEMEAGVETQQAKVKKKMGGGKRKGKQREEQQLEEQQAPTEKQRPRPRPVAKAAYSMSVLPSSDEQPYAQLESPPNKRITRAQSRTRGMYSGMDTDPSDGFSSKAVVDLSSSESDDYHRPTSEERKRSPSASESMIMQTKDKTRKPSSTRAASSDLAVLNIGSDSDASLGSRRSTKSAVRRSSRKNAVERSGSAMDVDFYDGDEDDVNLEVENFLDLETTVRKQNNLSFDHRAKDASNDDQTPKPLILPLINDIKPLMIARLRQSQKTDSESKFGEADIPRWLRNDERAPNLRALRVGDTTDTEVGSPSNYSWLLNDTSQSSMEGKSSTSRY